MLLKVVEANEPGKSALKPQQVTVPFVLRPHEYVSPVVTLMKDPEGGDDWL